MRYLMLSLAISVFCFAAFAQGTSASKVIAVADIELGNPTSKLVFEPSAVRDSLTQILYQKKRFTVIDWSRLSAVLFRRNLAWSDVVDNDKAIGELQQILLNDYFVTGSLSHFSERVDYDGGSFSKSKTQVSTVQIDLFIKDAITNQIIASSRGYTERKQKIKQSLGFGAGASVNLGLAQFALNDAMEMAIDDLINQLDDKVK